MWGGGGWKGSLCPLSGKLVCSAGNWREELAFNLHLHPQGLCCLVSLLLSRCWGPFILPSVIETGGRCSDQLTVPENVTGGDLTPSPEEASVI